MRQTEDLAQLIEANLSQASDDASVTHRWRTDYALGCMENAERFEDWHHDGKARAESMWGSEEHTPVEYPAVSADRWELELAHQAEEASGNLRSYREHMDSDAAAGAAGRHLEAATHLEGALRWLASHLGWLEISEQALRDAESGEPHRWYAHRVYYRSMADQKTARMY